MWLEAAAPTKLVTSPISVFTLTMMPTILSMLMDSPRLVDIWLLWLESSKRRMVDLSKIILWACKAKIQKLSLLHRFWQQAMQTLNKSKSHNLLWVISIIQPTIIGSWLHQKGLLGFVPTLLWTITCPILLLEELTNNRLLPTKKPLNLKLIIDRARLKFWVVQVTRLIRIVKASSTARSDLLKTIPLTVYSQRTKIWTTISKLNHSFQAMQIILRPSRDSFSQQWLIISKHLDLLQETSLNLKSFKVLVLRTMLAMSVAA